MSVCAGLSRWHAKAYYLGGEKSISTLPALLGVSAPSWSRYRRALRPVTLPMLDAWFTEVGVAPAERPLFLAWASDIAETGTPGQDDIEDEPETASHCFSTCEIAWTSKIQDYARSAYLLRQAAAEGAPIDITEHEASIGYVDLLGAALGYRHRRRGNDSAVPSYRWTF